MKYCLLPAVALFFFVGNARAQSTATTQPNPPGPRVKMSPQQAWISRAKPLLSQLARLKNKPVDAALLKEYVALHQQLFPGRPYLSGDDGPALASTLYAQLSQWLNDVQAGKYNDRLSPRP